MIDYRVSDLHEYVLVADLSRLALQPTVEQQGLDPEVLLEEAKSDAITMTKSDT